MKEKDVLDLLKKDGRLTAAEIARMLDADPAEVGGIVAELESDGVIIGYRAVVDDSKIPDAKVKAIIEVKIRPAGAEGFDGVAMRLARFAEVEALYLVSGEYDLELEVHGDSLGDVAAFVSSKLATTEGVEASATRFILKKYKESNRILAGGDDSGRLKVSP